MVAVLVLAALCEIFMGIYVSTEIKEKYLSAVIFKGIASLLFVLIGLICSSGGKTANLIVTGLVLGFIADILLNLKYLLMGKLGDASFVIGALLFLAGHIAYFAGILPTVSNKLLFLIIGIVAAAGIVSWLFKQVAVEKALLIFGTNYMSFITILAVMALGGFIENLTLFSGLFALGIFLFHISDVVLIVNHFGKEVRDSLRVANAVLYYTGQILVAISLIAM